MFINKQLELYNKINNASKSLLTGSGMQSGGNSVGINADTVTNTNSLGGSVVNTMSGLVETSAKIIAKSIDSVIPGINNAVFGDIVDKPWDEVAPNIIDVFHKDAAFIQKLISDPNIRAALKDVIDAYGKALAEVVGLSLPVMEEIVDDFWNTIDKVAQKSTVGIVNTGINVANAAISEIPVMGGIIDLVISFARAFNYFVAAQIPVIESTGKIAGKVKAATEDAFNTVDKFSSKIEDSSRKLNSAMKTLNTFQSGGKKTRKKTHSAIKRIRRSIKRFSR